ncbi:MAG: TetR/AcrR family transcriptional regulator [Myxococcota bacterium]
MGRPAKLQLDEVLKRATDLFWKKGCDCVTTRDLEAALDLRAPAIYRRFRTKDELLARCVDHYVDTIILTRVRRILEDADDPLQGLHNFFTTTLEPHRRDAQLRGCLLANTAAHADGQVPEIRAAIYRGWDLIDSAFQEQIARAQELEQIEADLDPKAVSQALLLSLQGLLTLVRAGMVDLQPGIAATFRLLGGRPTSSTQ